MACQELQTYGMSGDTVVWLVRSYRLMACLKWQTYGLPDKLLITEPTREGDGSTWKRSQQETWITSGNSHWPVQGTETPPELQPLNFGRCTFGGVSVPCIYSHARWGFTEGKSVLCCVDMMSLIIASLQMYLWWSLCEMCAGVIVKCVLEWLWNVCWSNCEMCAGVIVKCLLE